MNNMSTASCYYWQDFLTGAAPEYELGQCSFFGNGGTTALSQGVGWFILIGFGLLFTLGTSLLIFLDHRYGDGEEPADNFSTAGHSIKSGLTACDIVSKWTWAATLLQSSNVAYKYGVSGPFWYAAGASIQILLFSVLAVAIKQRAPKVHTCLQIVSARWGAGAHKVFLVFCLLTNFVVTSMLILGGAAVINALSGVNIYVAAFLIPLGVMFYTAHGGLKATYIASWSHVAVLYIGLNIFSFLIYGSPIGDLGSIRRVYDNLQEMAIAIPVANNLDGSYLTMWSTDGLIFGIINIIGNFGTVFVDQAYWQCAIAARPKAAYKGYLLGGLCWFAIPFTMATALGLGTRALNLPVSLDEANQGLVPPALASVLLGSGGAFLIVFQLWMAVTASGSAEQIAVSSLVAYDVYAAYINKNATSEQIRFVSRIAVLVYGVLSGVLAIILLQIGISLGWVYLFMGVVVGSAVFPISAAILWTKCSGIAAITGAICGLVGALIAWMVTAQAMYDTISVDTLGKDYPMLAGNCVAIGLSAIICIVMSLIKPQNYEWESQDAHEKLDKTGGIDVDDNDERIGSIANSIIDEERNIDPAILRKMYLGATVLSVIVIAVWPLLALPAKVFSYSYFTLWVIIALIWGLLAAAFCIIAPIAESITHIKMILSRLVNRSPTTTHGAQPSDDRKFDEMQASPALAVPGVKIDSLSTQHAS